MHSTRRALPAARLPSPGRRALRTRRTGRARFAGAVALLAALAAAACAGAGNDRRVQSLDPPTEQAQTGAPAAAAGKGAVEAEPGTAASPDPASAEANSPAGGGGLMAVAGPTGLRILRSDGEVVAELAEGLVVTQPTWSRDGSRLAATVIDPAAGTAEVAVVDAATWEMASARAIRPYFFYTWSHDGRFLAALGPRSGGGTSVDVLNAVGTPAANSSIEGGSMYVAWEPGGDDLLLHADDRLFLVSDLQAVEASADLGRVGTRFQAPAWVPGTRDFVYVEGAGDPEDTEGRLVRRNADTSETADLGPANGPVNLAVDPRGRRAALSHSGPLSESDPAGAVADLALTPVRPERVEIVDLDTGRRTSVLDGLGLWLEWSPDGERLLVAGIDDSGFAWHVWASGTLETLSKLAPTETFVRNYMAFANQYVETPRLWSPDGRTFGFGATDGDRTVAVAIRADGQGASALGSGEVAFWNPGSN